jgi:hypothetical protein
VETVELCKTDAVLGLRNAFGELIFTALLTSAEKTRCLASPESLKNNMGSYRSPNPKQGKPNGHLH